MGCELGITGAWIEINKGDSPARSASGDVDDRAVAKSGPVMHIVVHSEEKESAAALQ